MDKPATPNFLEAALNYMDAWRTHIAAMGDDDAEYHQAALNLRDRMLELEAAYQHAKTQSLELLEWFDPAAKLPAEAGPVLVHIGESDVFPEDEVWNAWWAEGKWFFDPDMNCEISGPIMGWAYAPKGKRHG